WDKGFKQRQLDISDVDTDQGPVKCWSTAEGCQYVNQFAQEAGLKMARVRADMQTCESEVIADMQELQQNFAINATPSFFINGRFLSGAMPTPEFEKLVDEELQKADDRIKQGTRAVNY